MKQSLLAPITIEPNFIMAAQVIRNVGAWLRDTGKPDYSRQWDPDVLTDTYLLQQGGMDDYYAVVVGGEPGAAALIEADTTAKCWGSGGIQTPRTAVYLYYLAVERAFAGTGLPHLLVERAGAIAIAKNCEVIRLKTSSYEPRVRTLYNNLGFDLIGVDHGQERPEFYYERAA